MQEFPNFLAALLHGIDRFEQRIKSADSGSATVIHRPDWSRAVERNEVAIGTGRFQFAGPEAPWLGGICLNDKQAAPMLRQAASKQSGECARFTSVTDLVLSAPAELFAGWRSVAGEDRSPEAFFGRFGIVVEDASPDSCFGLVCLLARLAGVAHEAIPNDWVQYIVGWERGDTIVGASVYCTYGCLHNALVHAKINPQHGRISDADIARAWIDGLRLMAEALAARLPPTAVPLSMATPIFQRARALLRFEEQSYEESIEHATCIQLALPIAETKNRYRLVDAYLAERTAELALPLGSLKVFLRTDKAHPYLKNGFTLMAVYRAKAAGDGDDMTISVDPGAEVELEELWLRLERAEDQAWGPGRPHDDPRQGIVGYPNGKRADGSDAPNEPWYDGRDYSLLAAPRKFKDDDDGKLRLGSKLKWNDVLELLWQTYQPFRRVRVLPGAAEIANDVPADDKLRPLEECYRETLSDDLEEGANTPHLFVAGWYRPDGSAPAFNVTPTLCRYLAACIRRWKPALSGGPIALSELPDESAYDVLKLPGVIAIVSRDGAFLLYDGQRLKPPLHEMKNEFERAVRIRRRIEQGGSDLALFLDDIKAYFSGRRGDLLEDELLERLTSEQIEIALELHKAHAAVVPHEAAQFRQAVLKRWGIESWLDALARDIAQIKNVLYGRANLDSARHITFLRRFALPVGLATVLD